MSRFTRCACGRWKATDHQIERWSDWCMNGTPNWRYALYNNNPEPRLVKAWRVLSSRIRTPIWWRLSTRCMGWYDCIPRDANSEQFHDYPWWVRKMFGRAPLESQGENNYAVRTKVSGGSYNYWDGGEAT